MRRRATQQQHHHHQQQQYQQQQYQQQQHQQQQHQQQYQQQQQQQLPPPPPQQQQQQVAAAGSARDERPLPRAPLDVYGGEVESAAPPSGALCACDICGRSFAPDRIEKHRAACSKASSSKRKVFSGAAQRLQGLECVDVRGASREAVAQAERRKELLKAGGGGAGGGGAGGFDEAPRQRDRPRSRGGAERPRATSLGQGGRPLSPLSAAVARAKAGKPRRWVLPPSIREGPQLASFDCAADVSLHSLPRCSTCTAVSSPQLPVFALGWRGSVRRGPVSPSVKRCAVSVLRPLLRVGPVAGAPRHLREGRCQLAGTQGLGLVAAAARPHLGRPVRAQLVAVALARAAPALLLAEAVLLLILVARPTLPRWGRRLQARVRLKVARATREATRDRAEIQLARRDAE